VKPVLTIMDGLHFSLYSAFSTKQLTSISPRMNPSSKQIKYTRPIFRTTNYHNPLNKLSILQSWTCKDSKYYRSSDDSFCW